MDVQDNGGTRPGGVTGRGFLPGRSGNPGGRPKNLETLVARRTNKGADLVNFMADVFHRSGEFEGARLPLAMRMEAATWLADRLWGKPKQVQEVTGANGGPVEFSLAELRERLTGRIAELAPKARARLLPVPPDADQDGSSAA